MWRAVQHQHFFTRQNMFLCSPLLCGVVLCRLRVPELEAQKKAAAAVRDFKEAARLSAEAKVRAGCCAAMQPSKLSNVALRVGSVRSA